MATDDDVKGFTRDLQDVKVLVARISTMQENSEKRIDTLTGVTQDAVNGMNRLSERMTATVGMEKDIAAMRDMMAEQKGDIRTIRHDLNNAQNAIGSIGIVNEKLNEATSTIAAQGAKIEGLETYRDKLDGAGVSGLDARVKELESWRKKVEGAGGAVKAVGSALWAVFGTGIIAIGFFVMKTYFNGKDVIGGE